MKLERILVTDKMIELRGVVIPFEADKSDVKVTLSLSPFEDHDYDSLRFEMVTFLAVQRGIIPEGLEQLSQSNRGEEYVISRYDAAQKIYVPLGSIPKNEVIISPYNQKLLISFRNSKYDFLMLESQKLIQRIIEVSQDRLKAKISYAYARRGGPNPEGVCMYVLETEKIFIER